MKYSLSRIFNIFRPSFGLLIIFLSLIFLLSIIVNGFNIMKVLEIVIVLIIFVIFYPLNYPKNIEINENQLRYRQLVRLYNKYGHGSKSIKVSYTITNITNIEYHQNSVEKIFNVGHICFQGETIIHDSKHVEEVFVPLCHRIYGITKFDEFHSVIESFSLV